MSITKTIVRDYLPPAATQLLRRIRGGGARFEGEYTSWEDASSNSNGYDAKEILAKVLSATLRVKRGEVAFERDSVVFEKIEYAWPVLSGLMWAAARNNGTLNVLDFGGALGSSYFQNLKFLQALPKVQWNIIEQVHYVSAGREYIQDETLRFYLSLNECLAENKPNVILLSSVLQYLESPVHIIDQLRNVGASILIIDRTPFSDEGKDKLLIQHVPESIYSGSYPMWVFSESEFMKKIAANWNLVSLTLSPEGFANSTNGFKFSFKGVLLESC